MIAPSFGIPVYRSPYVPEGTVVRTKDGIYFHSRLSVHGKMRRKHGRPRNHPRRWKVRVVRYEPDLDRLREAGERP